MVTSRKPTGTASSIPAGLAAGCAVSLGITMLAAALLAKLVDAEKLPWENVGYGIVVLLVMASFLGSITAYGRIRRQRLMICLISGMIYFGILLSLTALFFGGQYEGVGVTAVLVMGGSGAAGLLGLREGKGRSKRRIRGRSASK